MILKRVASPDISQCYSAARCYPDWPAAHRNGHERQPWRRLLTVAEGRPSAQMAAQPQCASLGPDPATDPDQPVYHVAPRQGWANDGNGFIYHKGRYHMCASAYGVDCRSHRSELCKSRSAATRHWPSPDRHAACCRSAGCAQTAIAMHAMP